MVGIFSKVLVLIFLSGCSLSKEKAFQLKYNHRKVIDTFEKIPLYSISADGSFNSENYTVFEFDGDLLTAKLEYIVKTRSIATEKYAVEIVDDVSSLEGLYRLHGSGNYGGKYLGITAITNGGGVYAKIALGNTKEGLLDVSRKMKSWQYVSRPLVGRAFKTFTSEAVVQLCNDLKYHVQTTTNAVFVEASVNVPPKIYFTNVLPNSSDPNNPNRMELEVLTVTGVQLFAPATEVYSLQDGDFFGIEYYTNTQFEKLQMKFVKGATVEEVLSRLQERATYNWESERTVDIRHRVLSLIYKNPIVTLSPYEADPIGSSTTPINIPGAYDWENTTQYGFNLAAMTAEVISVHDKITNTSSYKVRMISDLSDTKGIMQFTGRGVLNQQYGLLEITNKDTLSGYLVLGSTMDSLTAPNAMQIPIQDKFIAQQPHRVVIEMQRRGRSWVGIQETGIYSTTNTTNWTFDAEKLLVQAKIMTNTTPKTSTYAIKMLNNFSDDQGTFQLTATDETISGLTADTDSKTFDRYVLAVKLGTGVDSVRAVFEMNENQSVSESLLEKRVMWNLYEQSAVPSGNRIVKTLASTHPWVKLSASGYYTETDTEIWWFDPDTMSAVVMEVKHNKNNTVTTNGASYELEMVIDVGAVEGGFKLKNPTPIDHDYPNVISASKPLPLLRSFEDKFMYVLTGTAVNSGKAYIGMGNTIDAAKADKPTLKDNYHTLENAPLSAIAIDAAVGNAKNKGHRYVALQGPATAASGTYLPYETEEWRFSLDPLQVEIVTIKANNTRKKETYPIQIVRAINSTEAIFKYLGTGSLSGKFAGFKVQESVGSVGGTHLIITNADSLSDAETKLLALKEASQWTHDLKELRLVVDVNFKNNQGPWGAVDLAATDSGTTYDHLLYDPYNTTNFTFDRVQKAVQVDVINKGITNTATYKYEVMSQESVTTPHQRNTTIVRLTGDGSLNTKYLGMQRWNRTLGAFSYKYSQIVMCDTYGDTVTAFTTAVTNYYEVSALDFPKNVIQRAGSGARSGAVGDTLVMVDDKGIWNANNTQELRFRYSDMTVDISDIDTMDTRSHRYNIIVEHTTVAPANDTDIAEAILYLKSYENDDTAKLHRKFVKMKVESGTTPKKIRFVTADSKTAAEIAFSALDGRPNQWNFQDRTSTAIDVRVIATADDKTWTKLSHDLYYWDNNQTEHWTFDAARKIVRVESTNGNIIRGENYRIGMKESISDQEGIFLLAGSTDADTLYDGHMVYLGFGMGDNDKDANGLLITTSAGNETTRIAYLKAQAQQMRSAHNWNLREKGLAELHNRAIVNAAKVLEWRSLEDKTTQGVLRYDPKNYTSLKFSVDTVFDKQTNIIIQKVGNEAKGPFTFQHKMHQDVSDHRAIFQLYNGRDVEYTNKYMAIELGTAVNDRLLKVGIGDTPLDAQNKLNEQVIWNYIDKNMAEADDRIVQEIVSRGSNIWICYNNSITSKSADPPYTSANATNFVFIRSNRTLKVQYVSTVNNVTATLEFVYGYTMVEDISDTEGVFKLSGFGSFADLFVAGELGAAGTSVSNRARIAFGLDTERAKKELDKIKAQDSWNIFERKSLLLGSRVITKAQTKDTLVQLDDLELYDPRNTKEYVFNNDLNALNPSVQVTTIVRDVSAQYRYDVEMLEDTSNDEGYFRLDNQGSPDHNKYFGLKFNSGSDTSNKAQLVEGTSINDVKAKLKALGNKYTMKQKTSIPKDINFITKAQEAIEFISLTSNKVYVPIHTDKIKFDAATRTMNVISLRSNKTTFSHRYYLLLVSNTTDSAAWFYLKAEGNTAANPWHNNYIHLTSIESNGRITKIRMGMGNTLADARNDYDDSHKMDGYIYRRNVNFKWVQRDMVDIPADVLELLVKDNPELSAVRGGYYHPDENESWKFDLVHRKLIIHERGSRTQRIAYFMIDYNNSRDLHTRVYINAYPSSMATAPADYFHIILDTQPDFRRKYFVKMNYAASIEGASNGAESWILPVFRNRDIAMLSTRILTNMGTDIDYRPINANGQRIASKGYKVVSIRSNMGSSSSGTAPPFVRDNLHIEVSDTLTTDAVNNKQKYVAVIMQDLGANDAVVMLERRDGADNSPLTNTFLAIRKGIDADEKRLKIASGTSAQEALDTLAGLNYWNYIDNTVLNIDNNLITQLIRSGKTWVQTTSSAYNYGNTTNWIFNPIAKSLNIHYISSDGALTNTETYAYMMIEKTSDTEGIFQLKGYGIYHNKFIKLTRNNTRARIASGITIAEVKSAHVAASEDNLREQTSILPGHQLITKAIGYGLLAGLDDKGLHDPQNTTNMQFQNNSGSLQVVMTTYRNGVPIPETYGIEMIKDSLTDGKFVLRGYGALANKYVRLKYIDETANKEVISIWIGNTKADVNTAPMTQKTHINKQGIPRDQGLLDRIISQQPFVSLTDKKIYVPTSSDEFTITKISSTSLCAENVVLSVITANGSTSFSHTYNMIQVSNQTVTSKEATYYLKGTSAYKPWDGKYILLYVDTKDGSDVVSLRKGMGSTMQEMTNDYNDNKIASGFTARRWQQAKFVRKSKYTSEEVLLEMIKQSPTISIVRGGYNDNRDTDQWTFDIPQRKITIKKGDSFGSGNPVATTEYYFEIYRTDTPKLETGIFLNSYGTGGGSVAQFAYFKMSTEAHRRDNFVSMNYSSIESSAIDIATNEQFVLTHPLWRNVSKAKLSIETMSNMVSNRQWVPVDAHGVLQDGLGYMSTNVKVYVHGAAPGGAWRENLSLRVQHVNNNGTWQGDLDRYVPVPYQYNGPYDTIFMLERVTNNLPNTHKDRFVAVRIGTGSDSYRAKIGYGSSLQDALAAREALTYWNYKAIEGVGSVDVDSYLRHSKPWSGNVHMDGTQLGNIKVRFENRHQQRYGVLVGIQGPGDSQFLTYQLRLVYKHSNPDSNGVVFELIGFGQYGGKFIRFNKKDRSKIKIVLGSDEAGINASWSAVASQNFIIN